MSVQSKPPTILDDRLTTQGISVLGDAYGVWLCDIWGVVHNGIEPFGPAVSALLEFRRQGGCVVLISNAARPSASIEAMLDGMAIPREAYDTVITSGDVTRGLIAGDGVRRIFHVGPDRDLRFFDGLTAERVPLEQAEAVVCTGLTDDENETVDDYRSLLARFHQRDLAFYCANPDIVVRRGEVLYPCAGALAEIYEAMGGRTIIGGKPHRPIYERVLEDLAATRGAPVRRGEILAIGDGIATDMKGAAGQGLDAVFISGGIHAEELAGDRDGQGGFDLLAAATRRLETVGGLNLKGVMPNLFW